MANVGQLGHGSWREQGNVTNPSLSLLPCSLSDQHADRLFVLFEQYFARTVHSLQKSARAGKSCVTNDLTMHQAQKK